MEQKETIAVTSDAEQPGSEQTRVERLVLRSSRVTCTLYCGDCRDLLPIESSIDVVITDPPYPDKEHIGKLLQTPIQCLDEQQCRQLVFWSDKLAFPLAFTGCHRWNKMSGIVSTAECVYERNGMMDSRVWSYKSITRNWLNAQLNRDILTGHPTQKPIRLMIKLVGYGSNAGGTVLDPFMGSGTTGVACIREGRNFIGVEKDEKYFKIAVERIRRELAQGRMF